MELNWRVIVFWRLVTWLRSEIRDQQKMWRSPHWNQMFSNYPCLEIQKLTTRLGMQQQFFEGWIKKTYHPDQIR
ncbi:hypothetical protein RA24_01775 [Leisingera sp. ANG-M6]|nr:hypothetical protein RA24_01775 [Leisingera sp. ANG-M6]